MTMITLYTAPDCLRCKIVKDFLAEREEYTAYDFKADKDTVADRKSVV